MNPLLALACLAVLAGCGGATVPARTVEEPPGPEVAVALRLVALDEDETGMPRNRAELVLIEESGRRELHPLGDLRGACVHREPGEGELMRVHCWWAGQGSSLSLGRAGEELVVREEWVHEETGTSPPQERLRVPLPARARLRPIR